VIAPVVFIRKPRRLIITVHDLAPMKYPFEIRDLSEKIQWILTPKHLKNRFNNCNFRLHEERTDENAKHRGRENSHDISRC